MSIHEAKEYADVVVETLVEMGVISENQYGRMTEDQRDKLAQAVKEKSEE